ncbi:hypothetical protein [Thioalkalivibrio sp. XN8]|uniref:hypothetical protein n=1 Tax=Thioalkalivibrio sp. XN8 TaxID=2712863 RepID=UPI0013EA321A|nr:hypothetical protein [Thioalkalivibrio sp. XN8]NGP53040.1 hypothetical protein [Thioalkalivibrio sp. XN8]
MIGTGAALVGLVLAALLAAEPAVVLDDQFGRRSAVLPVTGAPAVVVYSDGAGAIEAGPWLKRLRRGSCHVIEVANLVEVPAIARPIVRRRFRAASRVLLDWRGELASVLGFVSGHANLYLFGAGGQLLVHFHAAQDEAGRALFVGLLLEVCGVDA